MRQRGSRHSLHAVLAVLAVVSAACSASTGSPVVKAVSSSASPTAVADSTTSGPARAVVVGSVVTPTGNELRFGMSPHPDGSIVLQPDVVLIGGGADAVRGVNDNGLVWTIAGDAANVDKLAVGKVMMATALGTGRVLDLQRKGSDVQVVLGPVALTDIIADADISTSDPVTFDNPLAYRTTDLSDTSATAAPASTDSVALGASLVAPRRAGDLPPLPTPSTNIPDVVAKNWSVAVQCCSTVGLHLGYAKNGAKVQATVGVDFDTPKAEVGLVVSKGKVVKASVALTGAAALKFDLGASVEESAADFKLSRVDVPFDLTLQVPVGGIPMVFGLHQYFGVGLGLSGGAFMSTVGEYKLTGSIGAKYENGSFSTPTFGIQTVKSALDRMVSVSVAPQTLDIGYGIRLSLGVGIAVLNVGAWAQATATLAMASSSVSSLVACKTVALDITGKAGIGYSMPQIVADAVNFFLGKVLRLKVSIKAQDGPQTKPWTMFHEETPPCSK